MQRRVHNLAPVGRLSVTALLILLCFCVAFPALARRTDRQRVEMLWKNFPEFRGVVMAVANVNRAMRVASENPMDDWRREDVRKAISLLPPAILGLADVFKKGNLHNTDLPIVQKALGGFVDINAANSYSTFLKNPSSSNIPKLGNEFPRNLTESEPKARTGGGEFGMRVKPEEAVESSPSAGKENTAVSLEEGNTYSRMNKRDEEKEVVTLGSSTLEDPPTKEGDLKGNGNRVKEAETETSRIMEPSEALQGDLERIEAQVADESKSPRKVFRDGEEDENQELSASQSKKKKKTARKVRTKRRIKRLPAGERFSTRSEILDILKNMGSRLLEILIPSAYADPIPPAAAPTPATGGGAPGGGGKCGGSCGGGEGGGGGGGGGGEAAQILGALAAAIGPAAFAFAQVEAAKAQAKSEERVAQISADAATTQAKIAAEASMFQTEMLAQSKEKEAESSERVAKLSQDGQSFRLNAQLAQLDKAQQRNDDLQKENLKLQEKFNDLRIASAIRRENQELETIRAQQSNALAQAGLSTGLTTRNSGLGVTRSLNGNETHSRGGTRGLEGSLASAGTRSRLGSLNRQPGSLPESTVSSSGAVAAVSKSRSDSNSQNENIKPALIRAGSLRAEASERLLESTWDSTRKKALRGKPRSRARWRFSSGSRGSRRDVVGRALFSVLSSNLIARGSSPSSRIRIRGLTSDLNEFTEQVRRGAVSSDSYIDSLANSAPTQLRRRGAVAPESPTVGIYKEPSKQPDTLDGGIRVRVLGGHSQ